MISHPTLVSTTVNIPPSSLSPFSRKQCKPSKLQKPKTLLRAKSPACSGNSKYEPNTSEGELTDDIAVGNRRKVLIGLGGVCGSGVALYNNYPLAFADPISTPDLTAPSPTIIDDLGFSKIPGFEFPSYQRLRVRPAAHMVNDEYLSKYKRAVQLMKNLPPHDPRNFFRHANIHAAYCGGDYKQVGLPNLGMEVHHNWLFFPWHRFYLYFYERILGSLINDPTFALPFWNWDAPQGMQIPSIYTDSKSPLFDPLRNENHQPPKIVDLDFDIKKNPDSLGEVYSNLRLMHNQVVSGAKYPSLFFGTSPYGLNSSPGTVESTPHDTLHDWTGDINQCNNEDMGNLLTAARDPIFFSHHSNVDRMWSIWKTLGGRRRDLTDPDWLNSWFLFYDEKKNLVRVKVKDSLDTRKLGYVYQDVHVPWINTKPTPRRTRLQKRAVTQTAETSRESAKFPLVLDSVVRTVVERPKKKRSKKEKEEEEEVLVIEGIEFDRNDAVKFDVFINDEDEKLVRPEHTEFAGSFVNVRHSHKHKSMKKANLRLGITDLLEDLEADEDDSILVTLVPRSGEGLVKIDGIKIEFLKE